MTPNQFQSAQRLIPTCCVLFVTTAIAIGCSSTGGTANPVDDGSSASGGETSSSGGGATSSEGNAGFKSSGGGATGKAGASGKAGAPPNSAGEAGDSSSGGGNSSGGIAATNAGGGGVSGSTGSAGTANAGNAGASASAGSAGTSGGSAGTAGTAGSSGGSSGSAGSSGTAGSSGAGGAASCGDGIVQAGEVCDGADGSCNNTCTAKISSAACLSCEGNGSCSGFSTNCISVGGVALPQAAQTQCNAVLSCIESSNCFDGTGTLGGTCYCGTLDLATCQAAAFDLTKPGAPNGACAAAIQAGMPGVTSNATVLAGLTAASRPAGAAMQRLNCDKTADSKACNDSCGFTAGGAAFP